MHFKHIGSHNSQKFGTNISMNYPYGHVRAHVKLFVCL